jgi:hypothetical protein
LVHVELDHDLDGALDGLIERMRQEHEVTVIDELAADAHDLAGVILVGDVHHGRSFSGLELLEPLIRARAAELRAAAFVPQLGPRLRPSGLAGSAPAPAASCSRRVRQTPPPRLSARTHEQANGSSFSQRSAREGDD